MFLSCLKDAPKVSCVRLLLSYRCCGPASWQGLTLRCWELWVVGLPMVAQSCASSVRLAGLSRWQWPGSHSMGWEISYSNANKLKFSVSVTQRNRSVPLGGSETAVCQGFPLINFGEFIQRWAHKIYKQLKIIHIIIMHFLMWSLLYTSIKSPNIKLSFKKKSVFSNC